MVPASKAAAASHRSVRTIIKDAAQDTPFTLVEVLYLVDLRRRHGARRARPVRDRLPRLVVHLAAADQRPAGRVHGAPGSRLDAVLRGDGDPWIDRGLLCDLLP